MSESNWTLLLHGGLRGRVQSTLDRLEDALEVFDLYMDTLPSPQRENMHTLMRYAGGELTSLRRLGDFAADAAMSEALHDFYPPEPTDILSLLNRLCGFFNEEAARLGIHSKAIVQTKLSSLPMRGSASMLCGIFANLFSDSLQSNPEAEISIEVTAEKILYRDSGAGLPQEACDLLSGGKWSEELLWMGEMGLFMVRTYAEALGWSVSARAGAPTEIVFSLPPREAGLDVMLLESFDDENDQMRRYIARELELFLQKDKPYAEEAEEAE